MNILGAHNAGKLAETAIGLMERGMAENAPRSAWPRLPGDVFHLLAHEDAEVRDNTAKIIADFSRSLGNCRGNPGSDLFKNAETIAAQSENPNPLQRAWALHYGHALHNNQTSRYAIAGLTDPDRNVREAMASAIHGVDGWDKIIKFDVPEEVRHEMLPTLVQGLSDVSAPVRKVCAESIFSMAADGLTVKEPSITQALIGLIRDHIGTQGVAQKSATSDSLLTAAIAIRALPLPTDSDDVKTALEDVLTISPPVGQRYPVSDLAAAKKIAFDRLFEIPGENRAALIRKSVEDPQLTNHVLKALGQDDSAEGAAILKRHLNLQSIYPESAPETTLRHSALESIAARNDPDKAGILAAVLTIPVDYSSRRIAARGLSQMESVEAVPGLLSMAQAKGEQRSLAFRGIIPLVEKGLVATDHSGVTGPVMDTLAHPDESGLTALRPAIRLAGKLHSPKVDKALVKLFAHTSGNPDLQADIASAMGESKNPAFGEPLLTAFHASGPEDELDFARALAAIGMKKAAVPILERAQIRLSQYESAEPQVKRACALYIYPAPEEKVAAAIQQAGSSIPEFRFPDEEVKTSMRAYENGKALLKAYAPLGDATGVEALNAMLESSDDKGIREAIRETVTTMKDRLKTSQGSEPAQPSKKKSLSWLHL